MDINKSAIKEKAYELLQKMTLQEKLGQLTLRGYGNFDAEGIPHCTSLKEMIRKGLVGNVHRRPNDRFQITEELQRISIEESRLGIPLLVTADMIHACETVFPIPLASSCSFDTALVEETAKAMAREGATFGTNYTFAPMIDVSRDPRWGRIPECQGEDPYLAGEMAKAYVRGFQNDEAYVMSTLKHYAAYGACEGGRDYDTVDVSENTMLNTYLIPFREGVKEGADSVMSSFNALENIPASGSKKYLRDILRSKFGFEGVVISDANSVPEMMNFGYCETRKDCAYRAFKAGLDIELCTDCYLQNAEELLNEGLITQDEIDECVLRVLEKKFKLGLFDDPYQYFRRDKSVVFSKEHLSLSEKMATESAVLLENNGVLPLNKSMKIALIGDYATSKNHYGCWQHSTRTEETIDLKTGLEEVGFTVTSVCEEFSLQSAEASFDADVVILAFGERSDECGEALSRHNLHIKKEVGECLRYLKHMGKKVVCLLFSGRPFIVNEFKEADALAFCWHLGHRAGVAVAKLLSGDVNFSGKLTVTVPRTEGQLPMYYGRKRAGKPFDPSRPSWRIQARYSDGENFPQYPFGYGLSYSQFSYGQAQIDSNVLQENGKLTVSVEITNESERAGCEIVQLYISDRFAEVVRPQRELKGFKRVEFNGKDKKIVNFEITEDMLEYYHSDGELYADAGEFEVYIGQDSNTKNKTSFILKK